MRCRGLYRRRNGRIWRIGARSSIRIERPVHDNGKSTFYRVGTVEARKAGVIESETAGLLRAVFKPERPEGGVLYARHEAGGTGLSGKSDQQFRSVAALDYDEDGFVTINLRLVSIAEEPRPLFPKCTPVPPPVGRSPHHRN